MKQSIAFLRQAEADHDFVLKVGAVAGLSLCYRAAHCQQASEKAMKALMLKLSGESGLSMRHSVFPYVRTILGGSYRSVIENECRKLFNGTIRNFLQQMDDIVPNKEFRERRNTEYPFGDNKGWNFPSEKDSAGVEIFSVSEVSHWEDCTRKLFYGVSRILVVCDRGG